jgi:hypothetical protein
VPEIISLLVTKGTSMGTVGRFHEAMALLDGATRLAERHALVPQSLRAASMRALVVMDDDPRQASMGRSSRSRWPAATASPRSP